MIDWIFTGICLILAAGLGIHVFRILSDRPHRCATENIDLPAGIPTSDIGIIERDIANLKTVMVVANNVDPPAFTLAEAVDHNFKRRVKYIFLISNDNESEIHGYYQIFEAYAKIALRKYPELSLRDLIEIKKLPYNWDDFPFIFYSIELPSGEKKTLAYRGEQLCKGIADRYGRVDPVLAHTIANTIIGEAPEPLDVNVERQDFDISSSKVIEFTKSSSSTAIQDETRAS